MESKQPSFIDLLLETHIGLERQGPGSPETMKQALGFLGSLKQFEQIADLGCGSGGQTMLLAEYLPGVITGLDMFPDFIDRLMEKAKSKGLEGRVTGIVGNMENLPFRKKSFDLIWSEGAIDNIGFEKGLRYWHDFLKHDGYVAVTCPSWITKEHPTIVEQFWSDAGCHLDPVDKNIEIMQDSGYKFIASFILPEECWTDNYFFPRESAIQNLMIKYAQSDTMKKYAELNRHEVELFMKYKQHYGYVFYIGQAI
ncbi:MAG: class I SAM-dependent methyltransferase [Oscillospiraceae bacterium]